jgi:hypothetical protein
MEQPDERHTPIGPVEIGGRLVSMAIMLTLAALALGNLSLPRGFGAMTLIGVVLFMGWRLVKDARRPRRRPSITQN